MINTGKYLPIDAAFLAKTVRALAETHGPMRWDAGLHTRGILLTQNEAEKLDGHVGTIRPNTIEDDCNEITQACLLRIRGRLEVVARSGLSKRGVEPSAPASA